MVGSKRYMILRSRSISRLRSERPAQREEGEAVPEVEGTAYWMYTATSSVPAGTTVSIQVEAFDRPRGMGSLQVNKLI